MIVPPRKRFFGFYCHLGFEFKIKFVFNGFGCYSVRDLLGGITWYGEPGSHVAIQFLLFRAFCHQIKEMITRGHFMAS
jgi:hypothetical protein